MSNNKIKIKEYILEFFKVDDTWIKAFNELENVLKFFYLNVDDVKSQCYVNCSNMKGKHQRVQKHFFEINIDVDIIINDFAS